MSRKLIHLFAMCSHLLPAEAFLTAIAQGRRRVLNLSTFSITHCLVGHSLV